MSETEKFTPAFSQELSREEMKRQTLELNPESDTDLCGLKEDETQKKFFKIEKGSKSLYIFIYTDETSGELEANAYLNTDKPKKDDDETTEIFIEAQKKLKETASAFGRNVRFDFSTKNKNMVLWAFDKGSKIFSWSRKPDATPEMVEKIKAKDLLIPVLFSIYIKNEK